MIESPRVSRWKYLYQNQKFSPRLLEIFQTIIEGTIPIESYCCIELNPTQDFTGLYRFVSSFLPTSWFSVGPCSLENSDNFAKFCDLPDSFTVISLKAKRKIWIDVPRTFNVFLNKSTRYSEMINSEEKRSRFLGILCRTLCTSTILLGGWYCQGMAFVAASYILFADNEYLSHRTQNDIIIGTYACGLYHNCSLLKHGLHGLYQWGPVLENYFKEFTHQITIGAMSGRMLKKKKWWHMCKNDNELQSRIGSYFIKAQDSLLHLNDLGYAINYYAVEWFTTSYLLSLQMDICLMIQDILIFGPHASSADILLKVGVAILSSLRDKILALPGMVCIVLYIVLCCLITCAYLVHILIKDIATFYNKNIFYRFGRCSIGV